MWKTTCESHVIHMWNWNNQYHMWTTCDPHVVMSHVNHMWLFHMWSTCSNITCEPHVIHMWLFQFHMWSTCSNITCDSHVLIPHVIHMWLQNMWICHNHMWLICGSQMTRVILGLAQSYKSLMSQTHASIMVFTNIFICIEYNYTLMVITVVNVVRHYLKVIYLVVPEKIHTWRLGNISVIRTGECTSYNS